MVDIVNQTDLVENIDGDEKLGQPMVQLSILRNLGTLDFFLLPYFRERTFPGQKGRLRFPIIVDSENTLYESDDEERHIDFAIKYSHSIGGCDFGISHFRGTGREPTLIPKFYDDGPVLVPYYDLIDQTGIDLQLMAGDWMIKMESIYRNGQGNDFFCSCRRL